MATGKKPPGGSDDTSIDVEGLFDDLFEEAPATDPTVPAINEDVTLEVPAAGEAPAAGSTPAGSRGAGAGGRKPIGRWSAADGEGKDGSMDLRQAAA